MAVWCPPPHPYLILSRRHDLRGAQKPNLIRFGVAWTVPAAEMVVVIKEV